MPSYAKVLTETYLPVQASKFRWESAKTVAGDQFNALAEQRRAIEEVRYRRQQYADTVAASDSSTDAFAFQAVQALAAGAPKDPAARAAAGRVADKLVADTLAAVKALPVGEEQFKRGEAAVATVENALKAARNIEEWQAASAAATSKRYMAPMLMPATLKSKKELETKAAKGDAAAKAELDKMRQGGRELFDLADNMGSRAFVGGQKGRDFYDSLTDDQQQLSRIYASALMGDGVVTEDEIPEGRFEEATKLHDEIARRGAYRRGERLSFDPIFLDLQKSLASDEAGLKETEARLKGKTKETLAEELYTGATERAAIPPLLRSLEPEMKKYLDGFTEAQAADAKTDPESYLRSKMTDREAKGFSAASAMAASGMRAADIMDNLRALSPEERRSVMGALASRDAIVSTQMKVASGTPLPEIEKIQTEDRRAREAELARAETQLQRRLRQLDESLAESRKSGFGGIVSPDSGMRPRRDVLMGALSPDDPASELPSPVPPRLDSDRGSITAGDEGRAERARYEASEAEGRVDQALSEYRDFSGAPSPQAAAAVRGALLRGLEPAQSVGPIRSDLRPEPFEFDKPEEINFGGGVVEPEPVGFEDPTDPNSPTYFRTDEGFKFTNKAGKEVNVPVNTAAGKALEMAEQGDVEGIKRMQAREAARRKAAAPASRAPTPSAPVDTTSPDPTVDTTSDFIRGPDGKLRRNPNKK